MRRRALASFALLLISLAPPTLAKSKARDVFLPDGYPAITDEDRNLTKVPYAEGAPAAVLLDAAQYEWFMAGDAPALRIHRFRRVKILTTAGIERYGDYIENLIGEWRVKKVEARTVLADGTVIDAAQNIYQEKSNSGYRTVRVAFPKVAVGSILDLNMTVAVDYAFYVEPWVIQERIPVLLSRFVMMPLKGLRYRSAALRMPAEKSKSESMRYGDRTAFVWSFENAEALSDEANLPPLRDISQTLFVIPEEFRDETYYVPIAKDWKHWGTDRKESWDEWIRKKKGQAEDLADTVAKGKSSPIEKAEAIRRAVRDRVRVDYISDWRSADSPDDVLARGSGTSGDVAGLTLAMLREAGVESYLAAIRRRDEGLIPIDFPIPTLFDDLLIRIATTDKGPVFFSPVADIAVGQLPWDCTDLYAMVFDGKSEAPVKIPDFKSGDNRSIRTATLTLEPSGSVAGESWETYQGVAGERWRRRLRAKDAEGRKKSVQEHLARHVPGVHVTSLELANLDDDSKDLTAHAQWQADGFATAAGKRLLVSPRIFDRVEADDWAAGQRKLDIDLGSNYEEIETVTLKLPDAVAGATVPSPASMNAGPVGAYEASMDRQPGAIVAKRHMRLEMHRFGAPAYSGLKRWFSDIAAADDKPVALTLK